MTGTNANAAGFKARRLVFSVAITLTDLRDKIGLSTVSQEVLASLLGARVCTKENDRVTLYAKATAELLERGQTGEQATRLLQQLWDLLEKLL